MEDKNIDMGKIALSIKRSEFLLEQILVNTIGNRFYELGEDEIKAKIHNALQFVDDDLKAFLQSLPPSEELKGY